MDRDRQRQIDTQKYDYNINQIKRYQVISETIFCNESNSCDMLYTLTQIIKTTLDEF